MDLKQAITARHSVRQYTDKAIDSHTIDVLRLEIDACNAIGALHMQLITEEPNAFSSFKAHYGKFSGVSNYIAIIGKKGPGLDERAGYYGERVALLAQTLGLNTCWVAATFGKGTAKKVCSIDKEEKLICVIALGYGKTQGAPHKSKPKESLYQSRQELPDWFEEGLESALLAPTALNQQKFLFTFSGNTVTVQSTGGPYSKVDLGIVKYHFEIGAGKENFKWA